MSTLLSLNMSVFVIVLNAPSESVWNKLEAEFSKKYVISDTVALVSSQNSLTLTSEIAESVGIGPNNDIVGMVFEISAWDGFHYQSTWEWLQKVNE